jgi:hypothetical protein
MAGVLVKFPRASEWWRDVMKVLVLASEQISADRLRAALGGATDDAEIMVVAPALTALPCALAL